MNNSQLATAGRALLGLVGGLVMAPAAFSSTCLLDDTKKVCVSLTSTPGDVVQPSFLPDPAIPGNTLGPTYVVYRVELNNLGTPQSARNVSLNFRLPAGAPVVGLLADAGSGIDIADCSYNATSVTCAFDKLDSQAGAESFGVQVQAPSSEGVLSSQLSFGWNKLTSSLSHSLQVRNSGGQSYVPPNTAMTLVTAPENPDPALQTDADQPLWAKLYLPPQNEAVFASIEVLNGSSVSRGDACVEGVFVSAVDGGPYLCRDLGNADRWVAVGLSGNYSNGEISLDMIWDASLVSPLQQPPGALSPTGTPSFAILYNPDEYSDRPTRAIGSACSTAAPPCISAVQRLSSNDWFASFTTHYEMPDAQLPSTGGLLSNKAGAARSGLQALEVFHRWWRSQLDAVREPAAGEYGVKAAYDPPPPNEVLPLFN